jgi:hypothetical protein
MATSFSRHGFLSSHSVDFEQARPSRRRCAEVLSLWGTEPPCPELATLGRARPVPSAPGPRRAIPPPSARVWRLWPPPVDQPLRMDRGIQAAPPRYADIG